MVIRGKLAKQELRIGRGLVQLSNHRLDPDRNEVDDRMSREYARLQEQRLRDWKRLQVEVEQKEREKDQKELERKQGQEERERKRKQVDEEIEHVRRTERFREAYQRQEKKERREREREMERLRLKEQRLADWKVLQEEVERKEREQERLHNEQLMEQRRRQAEEEMEAENMKRALRASKRSYQLERSGRHHAGSSTEIQPARGLQKVREVEPSGQCVVCQDEQANIALVDCGHLALCKSCFDKVMKSTRQCPLCRTRIGSEQRLLRIYRT